MDGTGPTSSSSSNEDTRLHNIGDHTYGATGSTGMTEQPLGTDPIDQAQLLRICNQMVAQYDAENQPYICVNEFNVKIGNLMRTIDDCPILWIMPAVAILGIGGMTYMFAPESPAKDYVVNTTIGTGVGMVSASLLGLLSKIRPAHCSARFLCCLP